MPSDFCLFIRNARILLSTGEFIVGDVQTRGREIVQVAPEIPASTANGATKEIDAEGLTLLPGVIDHWCQLKQNSLRCKRLRPLPLIPLLGGEGL